MTPATRSQPAATVVAADEGPEFWVVGDHIQFKITGDQTNGAYAAAVTTVAPGGGPPPHVHRREDELFYILEGEFGFVFDDQRLKGGPGTVAFCRAASRTRLRTSATR